MSMLKYIYWRPDLSKKGEELQVANVHLLVGYNQRSIADYQQMAVELRQTFPQAQDSELRCENVSKSSFCKGFTLLTWTAKIPRQEYPGWHQTDNPPEYYW